jgi:8-oxo-dGTP diphosphatase
MTSGGYPDPGRPDFCARCAARLHEIERGGRPRPTCPVCGWLYYARPATGAAVIINRAEEVLLVQRAHQPYQGQWMLPAGFVEYGEFAEDTAVREALEETGLTVRLAGLFGVYFGTDDPRNVSHLVVYHAKISGGQLAAGDDAADARFFPLDALPAEIAFKTHRRALSDLLLLRQSSTPERSAAAFD